MDLSLTSEKNLSGIGLMIVAVSLLAIQNVFVKMLGNSLPVVEIVFFRGVFNFVPLFIMFAYTRQKVSLKTNRLGGHMLRGLAGAISILCFAYTFRLIPLATAVAINFSSPFFMALLSFLFLHEKISRHNCFAIIVGFLGVMIMMHPSQEGWNLLGIVMAVASSLFYALAMIGVRALGRTEGPLTIVLYFNLFLVIFYGVVLPFFWITPSWPQFGLMMGMGLFSGFAQISITKALQMASAAIVSPFGYIGLLWASFYGWVLWGEVPDKMVCLGGGIIVITGLYMYLCEARFNKKAALSVSIPPGTNTPDVKL